MDNEQFQERAQKAFENDTTKLREVYRLHKKGMSRSEIRKKLNTQSIGAYSRLIETIEKGLPKASVKDLQRFINRHRKDFSVEDIKKLERLATECGRRANNRQFVQKRAKSKKETSQAEEALEKSDIAGIYVYTYPKYYHHPDVPETNDTDARIRLKIGMSEKDAFKRVMQQKTGMPERPMILQIWKVENDSDLREIEKKIHDHLRKAGHGDHSNEGREWFLTNEQFVASTASLIGLSLHYEYECSLKIDD